MCLAYIKAQGTGISRAYRSQGFAVASVSLRHSCCIASCTAIFRCLVHEAGVKGNRKDEEDVLSMQGAATWNIPMHSPNRQVMQSCLQPVFTVCRCLQWRPCKLHE